MANSMWVGRLALAGGVVGVLCAGGSSAAVAGEACVWKRQIGTAANEMGNGVATDTAGDIYVVGGTEATLGGAKKRDYDVWVRKYGPSGTLVWKRQPGTTSDDAAWAAATDANDDVYVTGWTWGSLGAPNAGNADAFLVKYDATGSFQWTRQLGTGAFDTAFAVATDPTGDVYLAGNTEGSLGGQNAGSSDVWLAKYDSSGALLWARQLGTGDPDTLAGVATDAAGDVYLAGQTAIYGTGGSHALSGVWLAKYDPDGRFVWIRQLGTEPLDSAAAVATDASGDVYVTGRTSGSFGGPHKGDGWNAWLTKYDSFGRPVWKRQPGMGTSDTPAGIAAGADGDVYMFGSTYGAFGADGQGGSDVWLAAYDTSGRQLWRRQRGSRQNEFANGVAADDAGNAYVTGYTFGSLAGAFRGGSDAFLLKFSPTD